MDYQVTLYDIKENGRCMADIKLESMNIFIAGFRVVPGIGHGIIVHMPKGMGTDWKYKEIEWKYVRKIITDEYLKNPQTSIIFNKLIPEPSKANINSKNNVNNDIELFVNLYNYESKTGDCQAGIILPIRKKRIEGFAVKNMPEGGVSVYLPKGVKKWTYDEIPWKDVQRNIIDQYLKERQYIECNYFDTSFKTNEIRIKFHDLRIVYYYNALISSTIDNSNVSITLADYGSKITIIKTDQLSNYLEKLKVDLGSINSNLEKVFEEETITLDSESGLTMSLGECTGRSLKLKVDFILPNSTYVWKNFKLIELADGSISFKTPYGFRWGNTKYPWNVLCEMVRNEFFVYRETIYEVEPFNDSEAEIEDDIITIEKNTEKKSPNSMNNASLSLDEKSTQEIAINTLGRALNAKNSPFAFKPHSILKLLPKQNEERKPIRLVLNSPNGGIGGFEIEILVWISRLKYVVKTTILDLVLSGFITTPIDRNINADKMTDIMDRLYKYNLIETSQFVSVNDDGSPIDEKSKSAVRIHTLGATGYSLLKEIGRNPERRSPFSILADGNTVKKHLTANQWLVYWLSHFSSNDILDYSINQVITMVGPEWQAARIYASINLENYSIVAEPIRRCEDFEDEVQPEEIKEKMLRLIKMFDNDDKLYTSFREQIVFPSRPIICLICEDEAHIDKIKEYIIDIHIKNPNQVIWFTTDTFIFNYDHCEKRMMAIKGEDLEFVDLENTIGVKEMTMEERGSEYISNE